MLQVSRVAVALFLSVVLNVDSPMSLTPSNSPIPISYFGMHVHNAVTGTPWPNIAFGTWRMWDTHTTWNDLEPSRGQWKFSRLDQQVALAEAHHLDILLPLASSPNWASARPDEPSGEKPGNASEPKRLDDWRDYVKTVATRYKGRIHEYEIWNEPNVKKFWTGSTEDMVNLTREAYKVLKEVDPGITVVSPSSTSFAGPQWLDEFLKKGGGDYVDVVGYHSYVQEGTPEKMAELIQQVKSVMTRHGLQKPLWDTEAGWAHPKPFPADLAPAYVARAYILIWAAGASRFYWYAWDNHFWVTLEMVEKDDKTPKPASVAYATTEKWLLGATLNSCTSDNGGVWTCSLTRNGTQNWIVWKGAGQGQFTVPSSWNVHETESVLGKDAAVKANQRLNIDENPQLFR
jgi:hypothetical protein